jgi:hypothetical protein
MVRGGLVSRTPGVIVPDAEGVLRPSGVAGGFDIVISDIGIKDKGG